MDSKLVFTHSIPVRWCDMDAFGHVNNSVYFSYFEIVRTTWWQSFIKDADWSQEGPVIITASCIFLKPIISPETISVELYVGPPGRSSFECFYKVYSEQDKSLLYAEGATKVVWVNRLLNKSIPLPSSIINKLF